MAAQIRYAQENGLANPSLDARQEAATVLALVDGLTTQSLMGILPPENVVAILDAYLDRLFPVHGESPAST